MAAIDLTAVSAFPHFVTTASVGTTAQEYKLPDYCTMVSIGGAAATRIAQNGASDGAAITANYAFCPADNFFEVKRPISSIRKAGSIFACAETGTVKIHLVLEG